MPKKLSGIDYIDNSTITRIFHAALRSKREEWSLLDNKTKDLDLANHVLRVIVQLNYIEPFIDEFDALAKLQLPGGSWPDFTNQKLGGIRNSCFSARNLIRANRLLRKKDYVPKIELAIKHVTSKQDPSGYWEDRNWGIYNAMSSSMGLMLYALKELTKCHVRVSRHIIENSLALSIDFLMERQSEDGHWAEGMNNGESIEATCHLLPKLVLYKGSTAFNLKAMSFLIRNQHKDGFWNQGNIDHTCDAIRTLLLCQSVLKDHALPQVIDRGMDWLIKNANSDGLWGKYPGSSTSTLICCDVLDCLSKFYSYKLHADLRDFWQ